MHMRRFLPVLLLTGLLVVLPHDVDAQDRVRRSRDVPSFRKVSLGVPATLHVRQGTPRSVEIEAAEKILDHLQTTVDGGWLEIHDDSNFFERLFDRRDWGTIDVYVTAPTIEAMSIAGSGKVLGDSPIEGESLTLENAGSGEFDLDIRTTDLEASIAGSGDYRLRGDAEHATFHIAGSGTIRAEELTVRTADLSVAGSGDTYLHVTDKLSVDIMGSGDVVYRGKPSLETSILGSGDVRSKNE